MKSAARALQFEKTSFRHDSNMYQSKPRTKPTSRVSRRWAVSGTTKHLERLSTLAIVWYVIQRHQTALLVFVLFVTWFSVGAGWIR